MEKLLVYPSSFLGLLRQEIQAHISNVVESLLAENSQEAHKGIKLLVRH
jgi:hypothetical protein